MSEQYAVCGWLAAIWVSFLNSLFHSSTLVLTNSSVNSVVPTVEPRYFLPSVVQVCVMEASLCFFEDFLFHD